MSESAFIMPLMVFAQLKHKYSNANTLNGSSRKIPISAGCQGEKQWWPGARGIGMHRERCAGNAYNIEAWECFIYVAGVLGIIHNEVPPPCTMLLSGRGIDMIMHVWPVSVVRKLG